MRSGCPDEPSLCAQGLRELCDSTASMATEAIWDRKPLGLRVLLPSGGARNLEIPIRRLRLESTNMLSQPPLNNSRLGLSVRVLLVQG